MKKLNTKVVKANPMSQKIKEEINSHYKESYSKLLKELKNNG